MVATISVAAAGTDRWVEVAHGEPDKALAQALRIYRKAADTLSVRVCQDGEDEPLALHQPIRFTPHGKRVTLPPSMRWKRPVINHAMLVRLIRACDPDTLSGSRDRLMFALAWELVLRRSDLAELQVEDITEHRLTPFPSQTVMDLFDQWMLMRGQRFDQWMHDHDEVTVSPLATTGPLFLRVDRLDQPTGGGVALKPDGINDALQRAVHAAKIRGLYSTDSLLLGGQLGE